MVEVKKVGKTCTKCGQFKGFDKFHKCKSFSDGYHTRCKDCRNNNMKKYYEENKEKRKQYLKENKEHIQERWKHYYQKNKEYIRNEPKKAIMKI